MRCNPSSSDTAGRHPKVSRARDASQSRRRTSLRAGRTLEGTLTFVVSGALASFAVLSVYYGQLGWQANLRLALAAAICGALAELFSWRIDDNLAIPVAASLSVVLLAGLVS